MALSVRTRFEVFKRDDFTCQYCGRKSPDVVLEVDHIVPRAAGGGDDVVNLTTSCWSCNSGKSDRPLNEIVTGEDPHDRAIEILERRRQVEEYNRVLTEESDRLEDETWQLIEFWNDERGLKPDADGNHTIGTRDYRWLRSALQWCPREKLREFMHMALRRGATKDLRYVGGCARNWRNDRMAQQDMDARRDGRDFDDY